MFRLAVLTTWALLSLPVIAQETDSMQNRLVAERPDVDGEPTEITVGVFIVDIDVIDDVSQRFNVDLFVNLAWRDQRLALPDSERSGQIRTFPLNEIWTPRGLIVNDRGLSRQLPLVADVDAAGNVVSRQRLFGELSADLNFENFPFDTQQLPIEIISYQYSPNEIRFSSKSRIDANLASFSAEGWSFRLLDSDFGQLKVAAIGIERPQLKFVVEAERNSQYYLLTMFLPMSLIVFMSWTAFWIQPNVVPPRIAISTASIFSLIAFGFSIRLSLPRVSYVTQADMFVLGCTLLVFVALGVAVIGSRWAASDRLEQALKLNAATRWIYLVLFLGVVAVSASA